MYVYRFINKQGEVIYIGRTNNLKRRMNKEHFTERGHLPLECYKEVDIIEYAEVFSDNEAKMYELYYIELYKPKYNDRDTGGGRITFNMPELKWYRYKTVKDRAEIITREELQNRLNKLREDLLTECDFMDNSLRGKDRVEWLNKLEEEERNEYIQMVYMMERYVGSIRELCDVNYIENSENDYGV